MDGETCREQILSQEYWDFIIPPNRALEALHITEENLCIQYMDHGFKTVYVDSRGLEPLSIERYWYNSIPNCYALLDMGALNESGITAAQNYPTLQLMGENIMIGFVDTGIDYTNDVFKDIGGNTRIAGIWDQTVQSGTAPEGFYYGSEYRESQINEALGLTDPFALVSTRDTNGHGTFLASVAAGSASVPDQFLGAAPEAVIGVVKLKEAKTYLKEFYGIRGDAICYQENDIMLGLRYLNRLAEEKGLPLIICIALGTNFGGHNSTSLLSGLLNAYSMSINRGVVIGGGNEANQRHHYYGVLSDMEDAREVEIRVDNQGEGFVTEIWTAIPNVVTVSLISPSGEQTQPISVRQGARYTYRFAFEQTRVEAEYRLLLENNNSQLIFLRFSTPAAGIWKLRIEPVQLADGVFHLWLPIQEFLAGEVYFLAASPEYTITEPASTDGGMTVAYYNAMDNSIDINSGRGYTRDRFIKPEFAAPGVQVTGAGPDGRFVSRTGSSVAVGITAGAAALLLEWLLRQDALGVNSGQLRNLLILGVEQKPFLTYPNQEWGYGTLNLYQTLDRLRRL